MTNPSNRRSRRGSIYVFVLGVASMVTLLGLSALAVSRFSASGNQVSHDWHDAQTLAAIGIDHALQAIDGYEDRRAESWRTTLTTRGLTGGGDLDEGTFAWRIFDANGGDDILSDAFGALTVESSGTKGDARHAMSVTLTPGPGTAVPLPCLDSAMHAGRLIRIMTSTVTSDGPMTSNGSIQSASGTIDAAVVATGAITGSTYTRAATSGAEPLEMPSSSLFDYYEQHGTPILRSALEVTGADSVRLDGKLLSPAENPFGDVNASGIYVIDCEGFNLRISDCRIVGTLVILNPGFDSEVAGNVNWEPAITDYPALLVDGSMRIALTDTALDESTLGSLGTSLNLNPATTPYQTKSNGGQTDTYPTVMGGIVYASADLWINGATIEGVVIAGDTLTIETEPCTVLHRYAASNPAPGFTTQILDGFPAIVDGSWRQIVAAPTE